MLIVSRNLIGQPVMGLQTGQPLAKIDAAIINPGNLKIVAFTSAVRWLTSVQLFCLLTISANYQYGSDC